MSKSTEQHPEPKVLKALTYGLDTNTASQRLAEKAQIRLTPTSIQEENLLKFNHNSEKKDGVVSHSESAHFPYPLLGHCSETSVQVTATKKYFLFM